MTTDAREELTALLLRHGHVEWDESDAQTVADVVLEWHAAQQSETRDKASRFNAEDKATLIDFATERIQAVWNDAGEVTAQILAENVVAAQEFAWLSMHFPVHRTSAQRQSETRITDKMVERAARSLAGVSETHWAQIEADEPAKPYYRDQARAALAAALEGDNDNT